MPAAREALGPYNLVVTVDVFCFPDTNTFLQFRDFQDINWASALGFKSVTLVITDTVISELEKFKYDRQSERRRTRSRLALNQIEAFAEATSPESQHELRKGVRVYLDFTPCDVGVYEELDAGTPDHKIIAKAIRLQESVPGSISIIVSDDTGMRIKAKSVRLDARVLPEEFRLPDEPTATEEQLKRTKAELQSVLEKIPQLQLYFDLDEPASQARWRSTIKVLSEDQIEAELQTRTTKAKARIMGMSFLKYGASAETEKRVAAYEKKCREYFAKLNEYLLFWTRIVTVKLVLQNTGNQPADDIVVDLSVIPPARLYDKAHLPKRPAEPQQPRSALELPTIPSPMPALPGPVKSPEWHSLSERKARFSVPKVLHHVPESLEPIYLCVPTDAGSAVGLSFTLHASNIPAPIEGQLSLTVEDGD